MDQHKDVFSVLRMARVLSVPRSSFYDWQKRAVSPSLRQRKREERDQAIKCTFNKRKGRSGSPRLTMDFAESCENYNRNTVADNLRRQGLRAKAAK